MNILAVDTSGNVCAAAVLCGNKILSEVYVNNTKTHSEMLSPMVDECLGFAHMNVREIDLFCCAVGPGSFTGLRIGNGLIKAFAHASGKFALGVNTLDALAQNLAGTDGIVCPIIDARRGEVYTASYCGDERITDYRAMPLDDLLCELHDKKTVFLGDGAVNFANKIKSASPNFRIAADGIVLQRAGSVGLCAQRMYAQGVRQSAYDLEPFYLRETQAERVWASKHADE